MVKQACALIYYCMSVIIITSKITNYGGEYRHCGNRYRDKTRHGQYIKARGGRFTTSTCTRILESSQLDSKPGSRRSKALFSSLIFKVETCYECNFGNILTLFSLIHLSQK